jgi:hypothetical protein
LTLAVAGLGAPESPGTPACQAVLLGGQVLVAGKPTGLTHDEPALGVRKIRAWPYDPRTILLAWQTTWEHARRADADGTLWLATCATPSDRRPWLQLPGADFGNAAFDPKARVLYATGPRGVVAVHLADGRTRELTVAPPLDDACWLDPEDGEADHQIDVVTGLSDDRRVLRFDRGAPCGFEGDWVASPYELELDAPRPKLHRPHPVATVAADAAGDLWLGDAGRCDEPGARDHQSPSLVWRSRDLGDSWEPIEVIAGGVRMHTAALVIATSAKEAGHLAVLSARCKSSAATYGGRLFVTRDAGKSWAVLSPPDGAGKLEALSLPEGGVDTLTVWAEGRAHTSQDGGKSWKSELRGRPPETWKRAQQGVAAFEATADGLVRTAPTLPPTRRVFPNGDAP